jgi:hypothetical protein
VYVKQPEELVEPLVNSSVLIIRLMNGIHQLTNQQVIRVVTQTTVQNTCSQFNKHNKVSIPILRFVLSPDENDGGQWCVC